VANALEDQFAEVLLDRIRSDVHPSVTQMDIFEAVAGPRMRLEYVLHLMERIEGDPHPSIPLMHRIRRVIGEFGT